MLEVDIMIIDLIYMYVCVSMQRPNTAFISTKIHYTVYASNETIHVYVVGVENLKLTSKTHFVFTFYLAGDIFAFNLKYPMGISWEYFSPIGKLKKSYRIFQKSHKILIFKKNPQNVHAYSFLYFSDKIHKKGTYVFKISIFYKKKINSFLLLNIISLSFLCIPSFR